MTAEIISVIVRTGHYFKLVICSCVDAESIVKYRDSNSHSEN